LGQRLEGNRADWSRAFAPKYLQTGDEHQLERDPKRH
jgi:hypothetical protein